MSVVEKINGWIGEWAATAGLRVLFHDASNERHPFYVWMLEPDVGGETRYTNDVAFSKFEILCMRDESRARDWVRERFRTAVLELWELITARAEGREPEEAVA